MEGVSYKKCKAFYNQYRPFIEHYCSLSLDSIYMYILKD